MRLRKLWEKPRRPLRKQRHQRTFSSGNWRLVLAVIGSLLVTLGLVILNIQWVDVKTVPPETESRPLQTGSPLPHGGTASAPGSTLHKESSRNHPRVTFYDELINQGGRQKDWNEKAGEGEAGATGKKPTEEKSVPKRSVEDLAKKEGQHHAAPPHLKDMASLHPGRNAVPVRSGKHEKRYTVQLGAFSQPHMAVERAKLWRRKGYSVSIRPLALPDAEVIYRLHVGNFSSARKADKLITRLKKEEGLTALRIEVRD